MTSFLSKFTNALIEDFKIEPTDENFAELKSAIKEFIGAISPTPMETKLESANRVKSETTDHTEFEQGVNWALWMIQKNL